MKSLLRTLMLTALLIMSCSLLKAQEDEEGCADHFLFNRMPNHYLTACEELEFSVMNFPVGIPDPENDNKLKSHPVEGKIMVFRYLIKDGAKPASGLQIMRNFQNAARQNGGEILGEYQGWCTGYYNYVGDINSGEIPIGNGCTNWGTTFKFANDSKEIWTYVQMSDGGYDMVIAEKEIMKQDIHANEMFDKLNAGETLTLYINFETGKAGIKPESQPIIDELHRMLMENPALKVSVEGHTDNVGNPAANKTLSEHRAASVKTALSIKGIPEERIVAIGYGQEKPCADNSTEEGKAKNRRVEIRKL